MIIKSIEMCTYDVHRKITVDLNVYKTQRSITRPTHLLLIITRQYQPMNLLLWVGETSILESVGYKIFQPTKKDEIRSNFFPYCSSSTFNAGNGVFLRCRRRRYILDSTSLGQRRNEGLQIDRLRRRHLSLCRRLVV